MISGNAAGNVLDGPAGTDAVSYAGAAGGVTVDLGITRAQDPAGAGIDVVRGCENMIGSAFDDGLAGMAGNNAIRGGAGAGILAGGGGGDAFIFSSTRGADTCTDFCLRHRPAPLQPGGDPDWRWRHAGVGRRHRGRARRLRQRGGSGDLDPRHRGGSRARRASPPPSAGPPAPMSPARRRCLGG